MKNYKLITLSSEHLKTSCLLISCDKRGHFAKFPISNPDLIENLHSAVKDLRDNGYDKFDIIMVPAILMLGRSSNYIGSFLRSYGEPPIEAFIPELKETKFVLYNADDQNMKVEL